MFDTTMIGKRIKQARIDKNMTQMALADAMGVSYQAVSNWERGNSMPDISKLGDLCATLDLTVNELLGLEESKPNAVTKAMDKEELTMEELAEVAPMLPPKTMREEMEAKRKELEEKAKAVFQEKTAAAMGEVETRLKDTMDRVQESMQKITGAALENVANLKVNGHSVEEFKTGGKTGKVVVRKADNKDKGKKLDLSKIADLAPFLDEEYLSELVLEATETSLDGIEDIAVYLSEEVLEQVVEKARQEDLTELVEVACHLSEKALERLVERIGTDNLDEVAEVACYMEEQALGKLVRRCEDASEFDVIFEIACYLSEETLDGLIDRLIAQKFDSEELDISDLYCYLGDKSLKKLAKYMMEQKDLDALEDLMPFV